MSAAAEVATPRPSMTFGNISFGVQGQSNANFGPDKKLTRVSGTDVTVDLNEEPRGDFNAYASVFVLNMTPVPDTETATVESSALVFGTKYRREKNLESIATQVNTGLRFAPLGAQPTFTVKPSVLAGLTSSGRNRNTRTLGTRLEARLRVGADTYTSRVGYRKAASFSPTSISSVSETFSLSLAASLKLDTASRLSPSFRFRRGHARDASGDYDAYAPGVFYSLSYAPLWGGSEQKWRAGVGLDYERTLYHAPDAGVDANVTRRDHSFRLGLSNEIPLDEAWSFNVEAEASRALSNQPNFKTRNYGLKIGFSRLF